MARGRPIKANESRAAGREVNDPTRKRRIRHDDETNDPLYVPEHLIPEGFTVEYKRHSILGQAEKASNLINLRQQHWEYVSIKDMPQFAELMPAGHKGDTVERDGVILMIRETYLVEDAQNDDYEKAREQVDQKTQQINGSGPNEFARDKKSTIINRTYERAPIPVDDA